MLAFLKYIVLFLGRMSSDLLITSERLPQTSLRTIDIRRRKPTNRVEAVVFQQNKVTRTASVELKSTDAIDAEDCLKAKRISILRYTESIEGKPYIADVGVEGGIIRTHIISVEVGDVLAVEGASENCRRY
jgi:hypothetical protein